MKAAALKFLRAALMLLALAPAAPAGAKVYTLAREEKLETGLKEKFGLGYDSLGGTGALDLRYWTSDILALEGLLTMNISSHPGGTDLSGNNLNNDSSFFGLGVGLKYNWKKPVENVLAQLFTRAFFISGSTVGYALGRRTTTNTSTVGLLLGVGFEAFVPVWSSLSVEGLAGLSLAYSSGNSVNTALSLNSAGIGVEGNGFTPFSGAIHYYF